MNRIAGWFVAFIALCGIAVARAEPPRKEQVVVNPKTATLAQALADWVDLLEKDQSKQAGERWLADEKAGKSMAGYWNSLRELHERYDYRSWLEKRPANAAGIGDQKRFTVGGHEFGHLHVVWVKTEVGWRIQDVFACR